MKRPLSGGTDEKQKPVQKPAGQESHQRLVKTQRPFTGCRIQLPKTIWNPDHLGQGVAHTTKNNHSERNVTTIHDPPLIT